MNEILSFIKEYEDILYVVAGLLAPLLVGSAIAIKIKRSTQQIKSGRDSTNIQVGNDVNVSSNSADGDKD